MEIRKVVLVFSNGVRVDITEMFIDMFKSSKMELYELADYIINNTEDAVDIEFE